MAIVYSSLYGAVSNKTTSAGAEATSSAYHYKGPTPHAKGSLYVLNGTYNLANGALDATNTQLVIAPAPAGGKLVRGSISSGDDDVDSDNDFTFNFGLSSDTDAFAAADTGLQAGAETFYTVEATEEVTIAEGDSFLIERAAGETNSSGTIYFTLEVIA